MRDDDRDMHLAAMAFAFAVVALLCSIAYVLYGR